MIRSIRGRVVLMVLVAQLVAVLGAVGLAIGYAHRALWSSFDSELQSRMVSVLALVDEAEEKPGGVTFDADQAHLPNGDLFYIQDAQGHPVAGSSSWLSGKKDDSRAILRGWKFRHGSTAYRAKAMLKTPILDQENHQIPQICVDIYYAMPANRTRAQIANATRIAAGVGILSLALSVGATWWAVGRGMRPLTEFARQADMIEADGALPETPIEAIRTRELVPLARALGQLVARVQAAFRREREFLSDAAHELKTAVAIQKSTLQLLEQGKASEGEYREGIARALEDTARTERLVSDMLFLSSIEHAKRARQDADADDTVVNLVDSLQNAIELLTPMAKMKSVSLEYEATGGFFVQAKEPELSRLWMNLIENAIQHSPQGSRVVIEVSSLSESDCRVRVVDSGSGIATEDLPHVFERFYRSDRSRSRLTGGFGLGLSIARAIVEKNHGSIELKSVPQAGTTVEVRLPRRPEQRNPVLG